MARFDMDASEIDRLYTAIENFPGNAEKTINDVFHNEGKEAIQEAIYWLMPMSGKRWKGKAPAARSSKSLTDEPGNLSVTVKSKSKWHYLYFPDDGTNTRRHVGNQQFFAKGAEMRQSEIVDLCLTRLTKDFEE